MIDLITYESTSGNHFVPRHEPRLRTIFLLTFHAAIITLVPSRCYGFAKQ